MKKPRNQPIFQDLFRLPTCLIGIDCGESELNELVFLPPDFTAPYPLNKNPFSQTVCTELEQWLANPGWSFKIALKTCGTPFQQRVWQSIQAIPLGNAVRYQDIAQTLHSSPRAVGQACGRNPFPLIIPCHRVTSSNGLGGFAHTPNSLSTADHYLIRTKLWLLKREHDWYAPKSPQEQEV